MSDTRFAVNHAHLVTDKLFEGVTETFKRQLGRFDPDVYKALATATLQPAWPPKGGPACRRI
jgi:hypothetical protein